MTTTTTVDGIGLRSERGRVLAAIMLCTSLIALDTTIIATAVPSIVHDVGGFSQFPWLFSIYLLTQAVTAPLYGKLADIAGRKPVMYFGIAVFLLGSVLCGLAGSMPALIVFRAVQGIGAGAVQPMCITVIGDLYSVEERARMQGYVASVWAVSAVIGPTLGGLFSEYLAWRWIFYINLPLGALAVWMLAGRFKEQVTRTAHRIDYTGAALLTAGSSLVILGLLEGGVAWAWGSAPSLLIFAAGLGLVAAFLLVERRAAEPILPLWVLRRRTLIAGNLAGLVVSVLVIGLTSYVPTFSERVLGTGALVAGFALAPLSIGWPLAAALSGRLYVRIGFRRTALIGTVPIVAGTVMCAFIGPRTPVWLVAMACFIVGAGLGLVSSPAIVSVQSAVGWEHRGVVTAANMFCRSIGASVGAAVFGAIANATLNARLGHAPASVAELMSKDLGATGLTPGGQHSGLRSAAAPFVRGALYDAAHNVFLALMGVAVLIIAVVLLMPRHTEQLTFD